MSRPHTLASLFALASLAVLASPNAQAANVASQAPAEARKPVSGVRSMNRAAFEALGDDALVEVNGKSMSKRAVVSQVESLRANRAAMRTSDDVDGVRESFAKREKAARDAANAPVLRKLAEMKSDTTTATVAPAVISGGVVLKPITPSAPAPAPASPATTSPQLTGMLGQVKPGNAVILFGSGFGNGEGEVRMYGSFPNGFVKLAIDTWGPKGIGIFIPQVTGVLDQQITLKVVTKDGKYSNNRTASFTATREIRKLKMSDFTKQECRDAAFSTDKCTTVGTTGCSSSVCGEHWVPVFGTVAKSTDRFAVTLKNSWSYESHAFEGLSAFEPPPYEWVNPVLLLEQYLLGNEKPTLKLVSGGAAPSFEIPWETVAFWADRYNLSVYVTGPAGTTHI